MPNRGKREREAATAEESGGGWISRRLAFLFVCFETLVTSEVYLEVESRKEQISKYTLTLISMPTRRPNFHQTLILVLLFD